MKQRVGSGDQVVCTDGVERGLATGDDPLLSSTRSTSSQVVIEEIYRDNFDRLCRLSAAITLDRSVGPEIVHDAFAGLVGRFGEVRAPVAYLQRSVVNLSVRIIQRRERARQLPVALVGHQVSPEIDEMWDVVCRLSPRHRAVVILRFWEDLSYEQIAAVLDIPVGTVQSSLHRALSKLREGIA